MCSPAMPTASGPHSCRTSRRRCPRASGVTGVASLITAEEFDELYRATAPELFAYLRRRAVPDVEDLVAEVFVTAWRRRQDLPAPMLRRAWLYGTARRLLLGASLAGWGAGGGAAAGGGRDRRRLDHARACPGLR